MITKTNIKLLLLPLVAVLSLNAFSYEDKYISNDNTLINSSFSEIIRFDALHFIDNKMDTSCEPIFNEAIGKIKKYSDLHRQLRVTVIGHTESLTDDANEKKIESTTYAKYIENIFTRDFDLNSSKEKAQNYADSIYTKMLDANISKDIISLENHAGYNLGYSKTSPDADKLSNRVMVTMYVLQAPDEDLDGVINAMDECAGTPRAVLVDDKGCAYDTDKDGVPDYKDICVKTPFTLQVDLQGCRLNDTLALTFKIDSAEILPISDIILEEFSKFMLNNTGYKVEIIGHTDSDGSILHNDDLSKRRALSTKKALVEHGIDASRLIVSGQGELEPVATNKTPVGKQANRRIEVRIFYKTIK